MGFIVFGYSAEVPNRRARSAADDELLVAISHRVDSLIKHRGCSIAQFAREAGVANSALRKILKTQENPRVLTLNRLGRVLGFRLYVFFEADGRGRASIQA